MKGPILPLSAKTGSPHPLPSKDRHAWDSCSLSLQVPLTQAALLSTVTGGSGLHSPCLRRTHQVFISLVQLSPCLAPDPPHSVEFINIVSLLPFSALPAFLVSYCLSKLGTAVAI